MKHIKFWLLSLLSGVLLALAWPEIADITSLIFIAFTPLLRVEKELTQRKSNPALAVRTRSPKKDCRRVGSLDLAGGRLSKTVSATS